MECIFVLADFDENETKNEHQDNCSSRYCYFDSRIMYDLEQKANDRQPTKGSELAEFKKLIDNDEEEDDEKMSSITGTFSNSPNKYPGSAKPLASLFKPNATAKSLIKEEDDEILEVTNKEMNYDKIKLQTIDGNCQIFYKNQSTIIN